MGAVGDFGGGDGDDLVELFEFSGFGHAGEGVFADVIHFGAGNGDDEVGLSDLGGGAGGEVGDVGAPEEGFKVVFETQHGALMVSPPFPLPIKGGKC